MTTFTWKRHGGYEVSSKGDTRFSAFYARLSDGRSIECHYQCDVKCYQPGGTNWRLGKGKPPLDTSIDLWTEYLNLWRQWVIMPGNIQLLDSLAEVLKTHYNGVLSDCYATTPINQAHALATLLNERSA